MDQQEREEALQRKREKAARYAQDPGRFTLRGITLVMRSDSDTRLIFYDGRGWLCSCVFFAQFGECSHTMTVAIILKSIFPRMQNGNHE